MIRKEQHQAGLLVTVMAKSISEALDSLHFNSHVLGLHFKFSGIYNATILLTRDTIALQGMLHVDDDNMAHAQTIN